MDIKDIDSVFEAQKQFYGSGITKTLKFRLRMLVRLRHAIEDYESRILEALKKDLGKHEFEAYAAEIGFVLSDIDHTVRYLSCWMRPKSSPGPLLHFPVRSCIVTEPLGQTLIIGPWNYPFQLIIAPLIGSIAGGNCAVVKPANISVHTEAVICDMLEHTFETEYIACFKGGRAMNEALLEKPFDLIFYTGNPVVARSVMAAAAKNLSQVVLELGGKSPCIIDKDVNVEVTARRLVWAKYFNAGQTCVAPDYVYVHKDIKAALLTAICRYIRKSYGVNPQLSDSYGRIINDRHFMRLTGYLAGENIVAGGESDSVERYIAPTVIDKVTWDSAMMQEEIFGPILPLIEYDDIDECIKTINSKPKPLALYIFSNNKAVVDKVIWHTSSGGVCVNDCIVHMTDKKLPFGGIGNSGMGKYHGKYSFECFTQKKPVMRRKTIIDVPVRYAPYPALNKWLKMLIRYLG